MEFVAVKSSVLYKYKNDTSLEKNPGWDYHFVSEFCIEAERIIRHKLVVVLRCIQNSFRPGLQSFSVIHHCYCSSFMGEVLHCLFVLRYCIVLFVSFFFFSPRGRIFPVQGSNFGVHGYPRTGKIYSMKLNYHNWAYSHSHSHFGTAQREETFALPLHWFSRS